MAVFERIVLWIVALIVSALGMVRVMRPKVEPGPVFSPAQTESSSYSQTGALPTCVPGTDLQIQALVQYEGAYREDGTGDYVSNVAALVIYNSSDTGISYGQIFLTLREQEYVFAFTCLPAGARLLVPEKNRLPYVRDKVTACRCGELVPGNFGTVDKGICLSQKGMSGVVLENTTRTDFKNVRLFYKDYLTDEDMYVGGITYDVTVDSLPAGTTVEIIPPKFVWGYSMVVAIRTE